MAGIADIGSWSKRVHEPVATEAARETGTIMTAVVVGRDLDWDWGVW